MLTADGGSFRDPSGRVYVFEADGGARRVIRGLTAASAATVERLLAEPFFQQMRDDGDVAHTRFASPDDEVAAAVMADGWATAVEHVPVEFLTWPYEWPFSMLKDAALLQPRLLETAVESGWMLKDATPFNIQWVGARPVFVDIPSFVPRQDGEYWQGYRQFCSLFLIPLMLTAHLRIPYQPLLRSNLEGHGERHIARCVQARIALGNWSFAGRNADVDVRVPRDLPVAGAISGVTDSIRRSARRNSARCACGCRPPKPVRGAP